MRPIVHRIRPRASCGLDWQAAHGYLSLMKRASITQTKNGLSALIDGLKGGEVVLIVDRGRPVARLEPVVGGEEGGSSGRLARLIRDGVLRPRRTVAPSAIFTSSPPSSGASAVGALIDERREGR
jgi:antitoxin (DNA-binding transcriptional repressor) of toxin-antitoxin stability system